MHWQVNTHVPEFECVIPFSWKKVYEEHIKVQTTKSIMPLKPLEELEMMDAFDAFLFEAVVEDAENPFKT